MTSNFADAVDESDIKKASQFLCGLDRFHYLDHHDQQTVDSGGEEQPIYRDLRVTNVDVRGTVAAATVSRKGQPDSTFYYRQEGGSWYVCTTAEQDYAAAAAAGSSNTPGASATPSM